MGGVLEQNLKVLGYASKTLLPAERRYSATEKEMLGVVWCCNNWRHLLMNTRFKAFVDHRPLQGEIKKKNSPSRLMRFKIALSEFDFEVIYKKGKDHGNADGMSRLEESALEDELGNELNKDTDQINGGIIGVIMTRRRNRLAEEESQETSEAHEPRSMAIDEPTVPEGVRGKNSGKLGTIIEGSERSIE